MNTILKEIKWEFVPDVKAPEPDKEPVILRPYLDFYGLIRAPFTITPDPEFLYSSSTHKTTLENILYGIEAGMGFILLTGEVGTGKTTLCRAILDNLEGRAETVYIINPSLSGMEIIEAILDDLGVPYPITSSKKELIDHLNRFLLITADKKPVVIIIDDAQTMTPEGLE
ncbi:MAG: AAA family ATPase, partial [Methanosarcina sp.]|nr:AAA family ATPase [Methanosarcina sp.]